MSLVHWELHALLSGLHDLQNVVLNDADLVPIIQDLCVVKLNLPLEL